MPAPRTGDQMPPSRAAPRSPSGDAGVSPPEQPEQPTEPITTSTAQIRIAVPPDAGARSKDLASAGVHRLGWPGSARWAHLTHPGRSSPCSWSPSSRRWAASRTHPVCPPRRRGFPRRAPSPTAVTTPWPASSGSAARWTRCTSGPTTSWTWTRPRLPPPRRTSRPFSSGRPPPRDARAIATARRTPAPTSTTRHRSGTASAGPSTTPTPARSTSAPRRRRQSPESGGETGWSRSVGRRSRRWGPAPAPAKDLEHADVGGRGLMLIRSVSTAMEYLRTPEGQNRLTVTVPIHATSASEMSESSRPGG